MNKHSDQYFFTTEEFGLRLYEHDRDEEAVCRLCWENALPGGRPFPLIPEAGALSFGRIITGPYARGAPACFYIAEDLASGDIIGYLTGAEGGGVATPHGEIPWFTWRDETAHGIAEDEFGEISPKLSHPAQHFVEGTKFLYTMSLGPRAIQLLLYLKVHGDKEMPALPPCPEFHFQVDARYRGRGVGAKLLELFLRRLSGDKHKEIGAQVTVCDGQVPLSYYERMSVKGEPLWRVCDRRETAMYTDLEKQVWGLGNRVENVSLVADRELLLRFVSH